MAQGLRDVAGLPTRWARWCAARRSRTGSSCARCGCRSGVVGMIYEARPNVTADAAGICLKSGNAAAARQLLPLEQRHDRRRSARRRRRRRLDADVVQLVPGDTHDSVKELMRAAGTSTSSSRAGGGPDPLGRRGVHGPGHRDRRRQLPRVRRPGADLDKALAIVLNAKTQRTSGVQRRRVAAGPRRRRGRLPGAGRPRAAGRPG